MFRDVFILPYILTFRLIILKNLILISVDHAKFLCSNLVHMIQINGSINIRLQGIVFSLLRFQLRLQALDRMNSRRDGRLKMEIIYT